MVGPGHNSTHATMGFNPPLESMEMGEGEYYVTPYSLNPDPAKNPDPKSPESGSGSKLFLNTL